VRSVPRDHNVNRGELCTEMSSRITERDDIDDIGYRSGISSHLEIMQHMWHT